MKKEEKNNSLDLINEINTNDFKKFKLYALQLILPRGNQETFLTIF